MATCCGQSLACFLFVENMAPWQSNDFSIELSRWADAHRRDVHRSLVALLPAGARCYPARTLPIHPPHTNGASWIRRRWEDGQMVTKTLQALDRWEVHSAERLVVSLAGLRLAVVQQASAISHLAAAALRCAVVHAAAACCGASRSESRRRPQPASNPPARSRRL